MKLFNNHTDTFFVSCNELLHYLVFNSTFNQVNQQDVFSNFEEYLNSRYLTIANNYAEYVDINENANLKRRIHFIDNIIDDSDKNTWRYYREFHY